MSVKPRKPAHDKERDYKEILCAEKTVKFLIRHNYVIFLTVPLCVTSHLPWKTNRISFL
jgi:hypothetical protein